MTSSRHLRSVLRTAVQWAVVTCAGLGTAAAQAPPAGQEPVLAFTPGWTTELPAPPGSAPANDDERIYVPLRSGGLSAMALSSGSLAWEARTPPGALLAAGGGLVFAAWPDAVVALGGGLAFTVYPAAIAAFDAATGAERWRQALEGRLTAPPVWNNGWLLVGTANGRLTMLRAESGRPLWTRDLGAAMRPGATMIGSRLYVMLEDGRVVALTLERGEPAWERKIDARGTALTALDDRIFVGGDDRFLYCLSAEDGKVKWRWRAGGAVLGTPVVDDHAVYFLALDNTLRALNYGNGHQRWKRGLAFRPVGGPVRAGALLLVPGLSADIPAFLVSTGAPAGKITVGADVTAPPLLLPGKAPDEHSIVVVTGESVQQFGPPPPVLESRPVPGLPLFLTLGSEPGITNQDGFLIPES